MREEEGPESSTMEGGMYMLCIYCYFYAVHSDSSHLAARVGVGVSCSRRPTARRGVEVMEHHLG